jgi:zinc transporter, ZIP family
LLRLEIYYNTTTTTTTIMSSSDNVGIAFALVIGAGASTGIGASVVFFPSLVRLASRKTLAGALGLSAGVMTYVSFVEIFQKSIAAFQNAGQGNDKASILAGVCFFAGVVFMMVRTFFAAASFSAPVCCICYFPLS